MNFFDGRYRQLVSFAVYSEFRADAQRYYLGTVWWILEPALMISVFYLVFGVLLSWRAEAGTYLFLLLSGIPFWQWTFNCVTQGMSSIYNRAALINSVAVRVDIFPSSVIALVTTKFFLTLALLLAIFFYFRSPTYHVLALPLILTVHFAMNAGIAYILAAAVPYLPDLRFVVTSLMQLVFFGSGIFYSIEKVPLEYKDYFFLNPVAFVIDSYRAVLIRAEWPDFRHLGVLGLISVLTAGIGITFANKRRNDYAKRLTT